MLTRKEKKQDETFPPHKKVFVFVCNFSFLILLIQGLNSTSLCTF